MGCHERIMQTCICTRFYMPWYNSTYNGTISMTISIFNLLTIPYLNYYDDLNDEAGQAFILWLQFRLNIFYIIELLTLIFVRGVYHVFTRETLALRAEAGLQIIVA